MTHPKLADAPPVVGTCPEGFPLPLRASLVGAGVHGEGADLPPTTCSIEGCNDAHRARGWCNSHYARWRDHGDPEAVSTRHMVDAQPIIERVQKRGGISVVLGIDDNQRSGNQPLDDREPSTKDRDIKRLSRQWHRMVERGELSIDGADKFCIRVLGLNPALVYGQECWDVE